LDCPAGASIGEVMKRRRESHIFEKAKDGWYVEPSWCSERLFEVEEFASTIYDPACGIGTILSSAKAAGYGIRGSDIVNRKRHKLNSAFERKDFMQMFHFARRDPQQMSIVCNPPFDLIQEFCEHAMLFADKVAMIMLTRRLNAAHWLRDLPLKKVYFLTPRPSMPPGQWIAAGNKPGGGTQDFVWAVFESGYRGDPRMCWLHRDGEVK
jgi:hypothetical protein